MVISILFLFLAYMLMAAMFAAFFLGIIHAPDAEVKEANETTAIFCALIWPVTLILLGLMFIYKEARGK